MCADVGGHYSRERDECQARRSRGRVWQAVRQESRRRRSEAFAARPVFECATVQWLKSGGDLLIAISFQGKRISNSDQSDLAPAVSGPRRIRHKQTSAQEVTAMDAVMNRRLKIAGIVVGVLVVIILIIELIYFFRGKPI